jgi:TRAP-type C4-dicarboxylate transport system permease small subunit
MSGNNINGISSQLIQAIRKVTSVVVWVSMACLLLMMFLTTGDVAGRYLFYYPKQGAQDFTELLLVVTIFMGIPYTQLIKGHVCVGILTSRLSSYSKAILDTITSLIGAAIFAFTAWQLGKRAWVSLLNPGLYKTPTIEIPIGPFVLISAIGCVMLCLVLVLDFLDSWGRIANKDAVG